VPRYRLSTYGRRAFAVAGPSVWNSLPDSLRDPAVGSDRFRRSLKTFLFATYWDMQRIQGSTRMCYINLLLLTYLLTYLLLEEVANYLLYLSASEVVFDEEALYQVYIPLSLSPTSWAIRTSLQCCSPEEVDDKLASLVVCCNVNWALWIGLYSTGHISNAKESHRMPSGYFNRTCVVAALSSTLLVLVTDQFKQWQELTLMLITWYAGFIICGPLPERLLVWQLTVLTTRKWPSHLACWVYRAARHKIHTKQLISVSISGRVKCSNIGEGGWEMFICLMSNM